MRSILAKEAMACIVRDGPYTEDMWFRSVPVSLCTQMDGCERKLFLDDMIELLMETTKKRLRPRVNASKGNRDETRYLEDLLDRRVDLVAEKALRAELRPHIEREAIHA